ncbi:MAG TPA: alpha amylase N-terminal ig-like domain-containing protein, partial [Herpetosiphonaceae bacterium]|nr:alpha amylase N-terminal ig-like domain-containing protein [Herpetosiphonaceae bacterium]
MSDTIHRRRSISMIMLMALLVSFVLPFAATPARPAAAAPEAAPAASLVSNTPSAPAAVNWCVAGSFQGWNNASTPLYDDGTNGDITAADGVYSYRTAIGAAGKYEFKAVECGNWNNAFPGANSWFFTSEPDQSVLITLDTNNHANDAGVKLAPAQNVVNVSGDTPPTSWTAVGDWQAWNNADPATALTYAGNGVYRLAYAIPTPGTYEAKIVRTGDWDTSYAVGGRVINGGGISFTTTDPNESVIFLLDTRTGRFTAQKNGAPSGSTNWCAAGEFQGWDNASTPLFDDGTNGDLLGGDGVYSRDVAVAEAKFYQWKVPECGNWNNAHPAKNAWFLTAQPNQVVKLTFDTNNHADDAGAKLIPAQYIVNAWDSARDFTVVGPFQNWDNANPATRMTEVISNVFTLSYQIPTPNTYEAKIVTTGNWDGQVTAQGRSANADNPVSISFTTTTLSETVKFYFDNGSGRLSITPQGDGELPDPEPGDGLIAKAAIRHHSRESLYKVPFGAITLGTSATLRLRTAAHDVESVKVRLYNTADNSQSIKAMARVATDGDYEYWEYQLPAHDEIGVVYYRFIISDGATTVYYEDDSRIDGGLGETVASSSDRSWNIYIYEPDFDTPEWAKNAVIYQIFVERFRNGDVTNDPTANPADKYPGETTPTRGWFYPDERAHRFPITPWNTIVPDPEPYADTGREYWSTYSSTMYGGDLKGVQDKLDYLQELGVTTLYLNPIFDSPSNHKYDGRNYRTVDPAFGGPNDFAALATAAHARGMYLVLDGVPNHVSSDSPYFDRFGRHPGSGACESQNSPYRSWFFFQDVPAGTGKCVSSSGVVNGANYTGWFGVQSLPQINTAHPEVMAYWFGTPGGDPNLPSNTASYWVTGDDKADGWRIDVVPDVVGVNPTFFETWRDTMKAANPEAVLYSETWPEDVVRDRVLGDEFDSTMNYRYRKAVLGFLRDTRWTDNDGGQEVDPLSPSQFIDAFTTMQEDYPKPAFDAAMNLIDSHDTNRAVHVLNELGFTGTGYNRQPVDGFADARHRLAMVAVLQMTLPGAPTIYYGDEVGLTGFGFDVPRDDPYNRQPYPWADAAGYSSLPEWRKADNDLLGHYQDLGQLRGDHSFLRTGSFDPLLTDDANKVLAYGRKDASGAAIVVMNRDDEAHTVELDLKTYVPVGVTLNKVLPETGTAVPGLTTYQFVVPANSYGIWVTPGNANMAVLSAPTSLMITQQVSQSVALKWNAVA